MQVEQIFTTSNSVQPLQYVSVSIQLPVGR